jgi:hypothetical protein
MSASPTEALEEEALPVLVSAALQSLKLLAPLHCVLETFDLGRRAVATANRLATILSRTFQHR